MKYVTITGGLGNQMFIYAFCLELRKRKHKTVLWISRSKKSKGYGHQGYELQKLFNVSELESFYSDSEVRFLTLYNKFTRIFPISWKSKLFNLIGFNIVTVTKNFIYYPNVFHNTHKNEIFMGTWQSELYFESAKSEVLEAFQFDETLTSTETREIANTIKQYENSVSIHIRRGDYLSEQYVEGFGGICTDDYYKKAIDYIKSHKTDTHYYVFTDDKEWVKANFKLKDAIFVEHNQGSDSWQDMYLMSKCKHNIIANSSFSWWGAYLNTNKEKIVVAPKKWWNTFEKDDVVPNNWKRI